VPSEVEEREQLFLAILKPFRPNAKCEQEPFSLRWVAFDVQEQPDCISKDIDARYALGVPNGLFENGLGRAEIGRSVAVRGNPAAELKFVQQIAAEIESFRIGPQYPPSFRFTCESRDERFGGSVLSVPDCEPEHLGENSGHCFRLRYTIAPIFITSNLRKKLGSCPSDIAVIERSEDVFFLTHRTRSGRPPSLQAEMDVVDIDSLGEPQAPHDLSRLVWSESKFA
jgi:hypothetical protein